MPDLNKPGEKLLTAEELQRVRASVHEINNALPVLAQSNQDLVVATNDLRRKAWINSRMIYATIIGLTLDLILSVLVIVQFHSQTQINARQDCLNRANQARQLSAIQFYEREVSKLYGQSAGFEKLLKASQQNNKKGAVAGFEQFLQATQTAADGNAEVLKNFGITTTHDSDGNVSFVQTSDPTIAGC